MISKTSITVILLTVLVQTVNSQDKPNLLFIMTDQQRYDALSIAGNEVLKTPNLDRLAKQGAWFKNAYTQCAVCAPARATILTGHTIENNGIRTNSIWKDEQDVMTMPTFDEILYENGYTCEYFGKWHCPEEPTKIYSKFITLSDYRSYVDDHVPYLEPKEGQLLSTASKRAYTPNPIDKHYGMSYKDVLEKRKKERFAQTELHGVSNIPPEHTSTAFVCKNTIEAIKRNSNRPFSITASINFPHAPMIPIREYADMYEPGDMPIPVNISEDMSNSPYIESNGRLKSTEYADTEKIGYMIANYYALVTEIDHWVGQILEILDELGLTENTIVIFTSDHGEMLGSHGMREKNVFYEESAHVPLMIRYPEAIKRETVLDDYVTNLDLFSTILDYTGLGENVRSDGRSLRDLIEGQESDRPEYIVTEWNFRGDIISNYMVIHEGWKLMIPYSESSRVINAMYDLNSDPNEMNNLLGSNPESDRYIEKAEELRKYLLEWLESTNSKHYKGVKNRRL
ncbi:sulfatase-like hydrolase/transferase [Bacteroidota bacterium]